MVDDEVILAASGWSRAFAAVVITDGPERAHEPRWGPKWPWVLSGKAEAWVERVEDGVRLGDDGVPRTYGNSYRRITRGEYELVRDELYRRGSGSLRPSSLDEREFLALIDARQDEVRRFLEWASQRERSTQSLRLANRHDISEAAIASRAFTELWWGIVVFTCFGSRVGAAAVAETFREPIPADLAGERLGQLKLPPRSIGHHRIRPGHRGAKIALLSACEYADDLHRVIHSPSDFDERYRALRTLRAPQWGRTTCFDLLLRVGALAVGGRTVLPDHAYLAGSTGPARGFRKIFGITVTDENVAWAETVLRMWTDLWRQVASAVGATWQGSPYTPGDFENALCIWQEG